MTSWTALFRGQLVLVHDAGATGDQVIDATALAIPPGVRVSVMGSQNIKGTGLDFIYRWLSLDAVVQGLAKLDSEDEHIYHEMLVHPALMALGRPPRDVLVLGGGDGCAVREVLKWRSVRSAAEERTWAPHSSMSTTVDTSSGSPCLIKGAVHPT